MKRWLMLLGNYMTHNPAKPLTDQIILNTRPAHQAQALTALLTSLGASVISFPTLEIIPIAHPDELAKSLREKPAPDKMIFISANAAHCGAPLLKASTALRIAIGPGTQKALCAQGFSTAPLAKDYSSEGLLHSSLLQAVRGQHIMLFCGENPKPLLANTLRERGASVTVVPCYTRACPTPSTTQRAHIAQMHLTLALCTSLESLQNLYLLFESHRNWLNTLPLLVVSEAMCAYLKKNGHHGRILRAPQADDESLVQTIIAAQGSL